MAEFIGRVSATESRPSSCTSMRFWVQRDVNVRPFDVVRVRHISDSFSYAVVQDLKFVTDSVGDLANFVSHDFGDVDASPQSRRLGTTIAETDVIFNTKDIEMPVRDGEAVEWADAEGIREALGLRGLREPISAGYLMMSNGTEVPIELERAYLLGPEGAHLNIAGISGLATKTSYAMFLLNSIQQKLGDDVTTIVFNVKGNDLLAIDEQGEQIDTNTESEYRMCKLAPRPFRSARYLYPYAKRPENHYTSSHADPEMLAKQREEGRASNYFYNVEAGKAKLDLLFSDIDDPALTLESIVHTLPEIEADSWESFRERVRERTTRGGQGPKEIPVGSWRRFSRLLRTRTEHQLFTEKSHSEPDKRRQVLIASEIQHLARGSVLVIDIEPLPDYLQCLVVGDVLQTIYAIKLGDVEETTRESLGTVVIFADELNKYAPKAAGQDRTLTSQLLEITERGRSLGVILFGAEQFRSGVHDRVLGNCGTNVYGRTSPIEIAKCPDYRYFPDSHKSSISRLTQGSLLLQHPVFKTSLIKVRFPRPVYFQPKGARRARQA